MVVCGLREAKRHPSRFFKIKKTLITTQIELRGSRRVLEGGRERKEEGEERRKDDGNKREAGGREQR